MTEKTAENIIEDIEYSLKFNNCGIPYNGENDTEPKTNPNIKLNKTKINKSSLLTKLLNNLNRK